MECQIKFVDLSLKKAFERVSKFDKRLYKEINKALREIKQNAFCGRSVKKKLIPRSLIRKYNIKNLWIYNLRKDWRLIYSVANEEVELLALVLDWMDHKDYEKLFKFT